MSKEVRFRGRRAGPLATPPLVGIWHAGDTRIFDRYLAHELGRACGPDCEGDCWAEFFVATWNVNAEKNARWFAIVEPAAELAPPVSAPTTSSAPKRTKGSK